MIPVKDEEKFKAKGAIAFFILLIVITFLFWYVFKLIINHQSI